MTDIVVEIRKGMVSGIFTDLKDARIIVVDWDLVECFDENGEGDIAEQYSPQTLSALSSESESEYRQAIA